MVRCDKCGQEIKRVNFRVDGHSWFADVSFDVGGDLVLTFPSSRSCWGQIVDSLRSTLRSDDC